MKYASGTVDQYLYFVALDATDLITRETGLSGFAVKRSRNGSAWTSMTTPTVTEIGDGVYALLLDEDMTIGAGNLTEEMAFHITHGSMAAVTRTIEVYDAASVVDLSTVEDAIADVQTSVDALPTETEIATAVLTRAIDSDQAAANAKCLAWMIAMSLNMKDITGSTLTVKKTDNLTTFFSQSVVVDESTGIVTSTGEAS